MVVIKWPASCTLPGKHTNLFTFGAESKELPSTQPAFQTNTSLVEHFYTVSTKDLPHQKNILQQKTSL